MQDHTLSLPALKVCIDCEQTKPVAQFSKNRNSKDGLHSYCKPCTSARNKAWRAANVERVAQVNKQWRIENKDSEERKEKQREYHRAYKERLSPEAKRGMYKAYRKPDHTRAQNAVNTRVRYGHLPAAKWMVCAHCHEAQAKHYHHFAGYEPEHWFDIVPLCVECHGKAHSEASK